LEESNKGIVKEVAHSNRVVYRNWNVIALEQICATFRDKGYKIMESLLINDPKLNGTSITIELPNEGSKLDFEKN
jgi:hypothetical protein